MKRLMTIAAVVTCLIFLVGNMSTVLAQTKAPYKIGVILPLTGYLSWLGEYMKKGAELKVEMINKAGGVNGRPLELIIYDDQSSPETATRVAQRLISTDGVIALQGTGSAAMCRELCRRSRTRPRFPLLFSRATSSPKKRPSPSTTPTKPTLRSPGL